MVSYSFLSSNKNTLYSLRNKVYLHFLKVRDGEPCILAVENDLKYGKLIEATAENN